MLYQSSLTSKGQVTIPSEIRKFLGLKTKGKVEFQKLKGDIVIKKAKTFLDLEGSVKSDIKYSDEAADKAILEWVAKEYEKEVASGRY